MMHNGKQSPPGSGWEQDFLWDYLKENLSEGDREKIEQALAKDPFLKDALEGLSEIKDEKAARSSVMLLQQQLRRHIHSRKKRKPASLQPRLWIWVAALALLLFVFIAWWVFSYFVSL